MNEVEPIDEFLSRLVGATIAGRFKLNTLLGQGGFGAVYLSEQLSMGRRCAVKVLVPRAAAREVSIRRFELEAKATSRLSHPNTVVVYDFGWDTEHQVLFLAMEYLQGRTLRAVLREQGRLTVEGVVRYLAPAAASLDHAHARGLVHRDVKLQNIMVGGDGRGPEQVKVIDFGIAKLISDDAVRRTSHKLTKTGTAMGTPAYMAPEQARGDALDGRADQYGLAVGAYFLLTGRPPFLGGSPVEVASKHLMVPPPLLAEGNPALEGMHAVDVVLQRALAKRPEQRFATCTDFVVALERAGSVAFEAAPDLLAIPDPSSAGPDEATVTLVSPKPPSAWAPMATLVPSGEGAAVGPTTRVTAVSAASNGTAETLVPPGAPPAALPPASASPHEPSLELTPPRTASPAEERPRGNMVGLVAFGVGAGLMVLVGVGIGMRLGAAPGEPTPVVVEPPPRVDNPAPARVLTRPERSAPPAPAPDLGVSAAAEADTRTGPSEAVGKSKRASGRKVAPGQVTVTVVPWGDLFVDGVERGSGGRHKLDLPAGKHVFELRQGGAVRARKTVDVPRGAHTMVELIAAN